MMNTGFLGSIDNMRKWGVKVATFAIAGTMMATLVTGYLANKHKKW